MVIQFLSAGLNTDLNMIKPFRRFKLDNFGFGHAVAGSNNESLKIIAQRARMFNQFSGDLAVLRVHRRESRPCTVPDFPRFRQYPLPVLGS